MKKHDWMIFEEIPRTHYHLFQAVLDYWCKDVKKDTGIAMDMLGIFRKGDIVYYTTKKKFDESGKRMLKKVLETPEWFIKTNKNLEKLSFRLIKVSKKLQKKNFSKLNEKQLEKVFSQHMKTHNNCHALGMPATILEWEHEYLSTYLKDYLKKLIKEKNLPLKIGQTFSLLTTPLKESFQLKQEKELIEIASELLKDKKLKKLFSEKKAKEIIRLLPSVNKKLDKKIDSHYKTFRWLPYMYIGPAWEKDYFVEQLKGLVKEEKEVPFLLGRMNNRLKEVKEKQKELLKILGTDKKHQILFDISRQIIYLKGLRKDALYFSFYSYEPLLKEIGKKLNLSLNQLRFLWPSEFKKAVLKKDFDRNELNERFKFSVFVYINGKKQTLTGKKALEWAKKVPDSKDYKINELEGSTAVPGMVKGIAKIINLPEDMVKMNEGDVLVSHATNPNLVPAMKKAAAIVTDIGGVTCHAAIVSRELNIPCVIGTKIATKVFKDGDLIDVNANHGIVKKLKSGKE